MNLKILFICLFVSTVIQAQNHKYLNADTRLYNETDENEGFKGYFKVNAQVEVLSAQITDWTFVRADNDTKGYVQSKYLSDKPISSQNTVEDNDNPILNGDKYYGGHHLFVTVASLRARGKPSLSGEIKTILTMGEAVPVKYIPIEKDAWVNISNSRYIQRKYLNERPDYDALALTYANIEKHNFDERLKIAERLVELAWNSGYAYLKSAYLVLLDVAKETHNTALIKSTQMYLTLADGLEHPLPPEIVTEFIKNANFKIKGVQINKLMVDLNTVIDTYGQPLKIENISDECGVNYSNTFYNYKNMTLSVNLEENLGEIVEIILDENSAFIMNENSILDHTMTETRFIELYSKYIHTDIQNLHTYAISNGYGDYSVAFKNGKIYSVAIFNLC
ncbi:SH3, type 3 domain protein [Winogradskyella psychrotolerans RS-3]|uniref:SH3, type 3 domain protein n=1 Tax=Winogradskyella psychrotolerans RS-3 TaxID=641526 RepID=S7WVJ1_9FLAO|nr:SH3 domain-containing protein [Winogradskyella psychrotolerans]EPR70739.1 SH3, type 3 domain protein [Winogradskyella psychrotolerans RS-3]